MGNYKLILNNLNTILPEIKKKQDPKVHRISTPFKLIPFNCKLKFRENL